MKQSFAKVREHSPNRTIVLYSVRGFADEQQITVSQYVSPQGTWLAPIIHRSEDGRYLPDVCGSIEAEHGLALALVDAAEEKKRLDERTGKPVEVPQ